jgi:protease PrsW
MGAVAAGVGPAIFWLWFVWRRDRYDREPRLLLAATFGLGAASAIVAALIESLAGAEGVGAAGIAGTAVSAVFLVGPIEEGVKFAVVRLWAYPRRAFNEILDGPVYAAAAATGFAGLENIFYIADNGASVMLVRGPVSTLAHVLFAMPFGLALGRAKVGKAVSGEVLGAYVFAAVAHGLFDLFLMAPASGSAWGILILLVIPLMIVLWRRMSSALGEGQRDSRERVLLTVCPHCGRTSSAAGPSSFCAYCGQPLAATAAVESPLPPVSLAEGAAPMEATAATTALPPADAGEREQTIQARSPAEVAPPELTVPVRAVAAMTAAASLSSGQSLPVIRAPARHGGFLVRLAAWVIDSVILTIFQLGYVLLVFVVWAIVTGDSDAPTMEESASDALGPVILWGMLAVVVLYHIATTAGLGGTLGKLILGYRVVTADLGKIGWGRASARYLAQSASIVAFGLGYLWIAFDGQKRSWHDLIAGTVVVRAG